MIGHDSSKAGKIGSGEAQHLIGAQAHNQAADGGDKLREHGRPGGSGYAHLEGHDKHDIQHDVQQRRKYQKIERVFAVAQGAQDIGNHVVEDRGPASQQDHKHIVVGLLIDILRHLHPVQNRVGEAAAQHSDQRREKHGEQSGGGDAAAHSAFVAGAEALAQADSEAVGKALDKAEDKIDNDAAGAYRGQGVRAQRPADDDRIGKGVKELKEISADDGQGEFQKDLEGTAFRKVHAGSC